MNAGIWTIAPTLFVAACMTAPNNRDVLDDHTQPVTFSVWALAQGVNVTIWCEPYYFQGQRQLVTTLTTGAFVWERQGDAVHLASGRAVVPEACWSYFHDSYHTLIHATQAEQYKYFTFDDDGLDCLYDSTLSNGISPITSAVDCNTGTDLVLNARN